MFRGEKVMRCSKVGKRSVYINLEEDGFDVYYQMKGYPLKFAFGLPLPSDPDSIDYDDLFELAWGNFEIYEEEMFN